MVPVHQTNDLTSAAMTFFTASQFYCDDRSFRVRASEPWSSQVPTWGERALIFARWHLSPSWPNWDPLCQPVRHRLALWTAFLQGIVFFFFFFTFVLNFGTFICTVCINVCTLCIHWSAMPSSQHGLTLVINSIPVNWWQNCGHAKASISSKVTKLATRKRRKCFTGPSKPKAADQGSKLPIQSCAHGMW